MRRFKSADQAQRFLSTRSRRMRDTLAAPVEPTVGKNQNCTVVCSMFKRQIQVESARYRRRLMCCEPTKSKTGIFIAVTASELGLWLECPSRLSAALPKAARQSSLSERSSRAVDTGILRVVWNRKRDWHVCKAALRLASRGSPRLGPLCGGESAVWRALDSDFDLTSSSGQRHPKFGANRQAFTKCVSNVRFRLGFGLSLAGTAKDR